MAGKYEDYPEYKDSGVDWLGKVPANWRVLPVKRIADIHNGATPKSGVKSYWDGDVSWITPADLGKTRSPYIADGARSISVSGYNSCGTTLVPENSILLSCRAPIGTLGIAEKELCTNQGCKSLVLQSGFNTKFLYYALLSNTEQLNLFGRGTTFLELSSDELGFFKIASPPHTEREHIANFLDHETAKIDTLIEEQQSLIRLLQEKRQAVISHAVTKGLNPQAPMKDSGVEWLGEVPEHWEVKQLMYLVEESRRIMYGIVLPGPNVDIGVPIVKGGDVKPGRLTETSLCKTTFEIEANYERSRLREGDLVYSIRGTIGDVEIVPKEIDGANLTQDAARIAPREHVNNIWLKFVMESTQVFSQLEVGSLGAAVRGINICDLKKVYLPVPPQKEMDEIALYIDALLSKMDELSFDCDKQIKLLQERRTALISAAVTGKIDVRNWVAPTPEKQEQPAVEED